MQLYINFAINLTKFSFFQVRKIIQNVRILFIHKQICQRETTIHVLWVLDLNSSRITLIRIILQLNKTNQYLIAYPINIIIIREFCQNPINVNDILNLLLSLSSCIQTLILESFKSRKRFQILFEIRKSTNLYSHDQKYI